MSLVACGRCNRQIGKDEQSYYYCKTVGFCIWCADGQSKLGEFHE